MQDYVNDWLESQKAGKTDFERLSVPRMTCKDGTTLSVQASRGHYCSPRGDEGPWSSVEVWLVEGPSGRTIYPRSFGGGGRDGPWGWVPVNLVNLFIKRHGGMA